MPIKIMLDPGHIIGSNRSPVVPEYNEGDMVWRLHLLLKAELELYGFEVGTTRDDPSKDLGLKARGQKSKGYDMFISLHSDAINGEDKEHIRHASVFYAFDNLNNASVLALALSKTVSECMGVTAYAKTYKSEAGDWEWYSVLYGARSVGCPLYFIIEHSFHTNAESARWLLNENNLKKLAQEEAKTIAAYYGVEKKEEKPNTSSSYTAEMLQLSKTQNRNHAQVKVLQALLNGYGYACGSVDGDFGAKTDSAVKAYQTANNLAVDGWVGKNTWHKLLGGEL